MASILDLRRIRYFQAIAQVGSFSEAARVLRVAQPALTHHIANLEEAFGIVLFERLPRGVSLTPAGTVLLGHAGLILEAFRTAEEAMRDFSSKSIKRSIRIGLISSLADSLVAPLVFELQLRLPDVFPRIQKLSALQCHELIANGEIDIAVTVPVGPWKEGEVLASDPLLFVTGTKGVVESKQPVPFSRIVETTLIIPANGGLRDVIDKAVADTGIKLSSFIEIDGIGTRKEAAIAGLGNTILPWANVARECAAGLLRAYPIEGVPLRRCLLFRSAHRIDPVLSTTIRSIFEQLLNVTELYPGITG